MARELIESEIEDRSKLKQRVYDNQYDGFNQFDQQEPKQRNFFIRTYNDIDCVYNTLARNYCSAIKHFHIIQHNADKVKGTHCHIVLVTVGATKPSAVWGWFKDCYQLVPEDRKGQYGNTYVEIPDNIINCYQYLIHANDHDKEPYDPMQIRHYGNAKPCMDAIGQIPEYEKSVRCWEDYKNGMSEDLLIHKYGRDYIYHQKSYSNIMSSHNRFKNLTLQVEDLQHKIDLISQVCDNMRGIVFTQFINSEKDIDYSEYMIIHKNRFNELRCLQKIFDIIISDDQDQLCESRVDKFLIGDEEVERTISHNFSYAELYNNVKENMK